MTTVILVSLLAPIAAGALLLVARRLLPKLVADARGIALQTVIVIVVMLAIAGAVAGVLLSTGGEVTSELESAQLSGARITNEAQCISHRMGGEVGEFSSGSGTCTWQHDDVSPILCSQVRGQAVGAFTATTNAGDNRNGNADNSDDQCVVTV